jgi:hypothetical protein
MDELRMLTIRAFETFCDTKKLANVSKKLAKLAKFIQTFQNSLHL